MKLASDRAHRLSRLLGRSGSARRVGDAPFEHLEGRQMLALTGVTLTSFPLEFYNASGVLTYDAASQQLDVNATPTGLFLADGPHPISATHGDFQIHARVGASGQLLGGVAGDDFIYRGTTDLGSGPVTGDLLTGEIYAFGFFDSGGPTDQYDYRFVVTGGLLAPLFAGRDIGVIMTSENSTFANDFSVNFGGRAKGTAGPIATPVLSSIAGNVYYDQNNDGVFQNTESPIPGALVTLTGINDAGQAVNLSTNTLGDGSYFFGNLRPGTYKLTETQPAGYLDGKDTIGTPGGTTTNDMFSDIVLPAGYNGVENNFGEVLPPVKGKIRGTKYLDLTGNGLTPDDTGFGGVTIYIDYNNDGVKNSNEPSTITASDGSYEFGGLNAGNYIIREVVPNGYIRTFPVLTDRYVVTLSTGQTVTGINFANAEKGCDCFTISNVYYIINGTKVVTDLRGNTNQGDEVTVWFTLSGNAPAEQFTLVSYTAPGSTFVAADAYLQEIYDLDTGFFAAGTHSLSVVIPDSYYQIDFVCGAAIDTFEQEPLPAGHP
ncbi:MAG TPA: SdrD B-like domain-containing protein, partial [Phycisphaerales bacterium]|nr:SdrD B-like domain-containing protein [Phycisphaerales bacterium]